MEEDFNLSHLIALLDEKVPLNWSEKWDNSGLQLGDPDSSINSILFSLNPSSSAISYAVEKKNDLLITHHPLFFHPVKQIDSSIWPGNLIYSAIKNGLSIISLHTNLDNARFGISVKIVEKLGWKYDSPLVVEENGWGPGVIGEFDSFRTVSEVAEELMEKLSLNSLRISPCRKKVKKFAFCGGSCFSLAGEVLGTDIDLFVTSDVKYHEMLDSSEKHLCVISVDHSVEWVGFKKFVPMIFSWIKEKGWRLPNYNFFEEDIKVSWHTK